MAEKPYQPPSPVPPDEAGAGGRTLPTGWSEKTDEILVKKPVYLRGWFLKLMLVLSLIIVAAGAVVGAFLYKWHREQQAELTRQRRSVEAFVASPAFAAFAREADAQLLASLNYSTLRPETVGPLLPDIAAAEKARHQVPWPVELPLLSVQTKEHPARVRAATQAATDLLAQRGLAFDGERIAAARRVFLRLVIPHARTFLAENTSASFPALFLDRRMQNILLTAYAERGGGTLAETERAFVFYSIVGPAMWREIETMPAPPAAPGL